MKTELTELLTKITPLPWCLPSETDIALDGIPKITIGEFDGYHIAYAIGDVPELPMAQNAAYIVHAANFLPQLVEAAQAMVNATKWPTPPRNRLEIAERLQSALTAANQIETK